MLLQVMARLLACRPYERAASFFINFPQPAGRPLAHYDETALTSLIDCCDYFSESEQRAAKCTRGIRNLLAHVKDGAILDVEFNKEFDNAEQAAIDLGGSSSGVAAIRRGAERHFPAASTEHKMKQKVKQYEQAHGESTVKILEADQCSLLVCLLQREAPHRGKYEAGPGTGKSLLIVKYAAGHLNAALYNPSQPTFHCWC